MSQKQRDLNKMNPQLANAYAHGMRDGYHDREANRTPEHSHTHYNIRQYSDIGEWKCYNNGYFRVYRVPDTVSRQRGTDEPNVPARHR